MMFRDRVADELRYLRWRLQRLARTIRPCGGCGHRCIRKYTTRYTNEGVTHYCGLDCSGFWDDVTREGTGR